MKISKLIPKNSIFSRLVITFLVIMIPIYILGIFIYYWGVHTVKSEITKSTTAQVSFYLEGLEKEIERIKILQYDCLNDEHLNKLAIRWDIMDAYDRTESMRQLQLRLVTIKNSSVYIENVSVHIPPIKKSISSNTLVDDVNIEKYRDIRVPPGQKGAQIIYLNDNQYLSTLQQNTLTTNNPLYLIEIKLSNNAFMKALDQFNTYDGNGLFLVSLTNNSIIASLADSGINLSTTEVLQGMDSEDMGEMKFVNIDGKGYYIANAKSVYLNMVLLKYIPEKFIVEPIQNFYIWVWAFSIVAVFIILIYAFSTYKLMHEPLRMLVKSFYKVECGDLSVSINHDSNNEFGYLYKRFNSMVKNINTLIDQVYNQKILMQRAELKQLQSQINPHFLYNSFFMINTMATVGDENLIPFSKKLGEYFRFVTRNSSDYIPLEDEIKHARVYAGILQMRFTKKLVIKFAECPEKEKRLSVPRLIIQPILENAFEHGIKTKKKNAIISVSFDVTDNELKIIVEDNGNELSDAKLVELQNSLSHYEEEREITGIINIHHRVKLVFGEDSGIELYRSKLGGLKAVLKIKLSGG